MTRALIVIPARFASTRLPGKPLLADTGKPLIQHTVERAMAVRGAEVLVATDDDRIADAVRGFGGNVAMTSPDHQSGTDRVAEAVAGRHPRVVVNVQGDEPEVKPADIETLIETHLSLQDGPNPVFASTLVCPFPEDADPALPSSVKAVLTAPGIGPRRALYFSRSLVPYPRTAVQAPFLHIGLYAFTPASLARFPTLPRTPLEETEGLEQLRILEHGFSIGAAVVEAAAPGIDTPEDYRAFVARMTATDKAAS